MLTILKSKFLRQEDGAVTVDWVVLTAAIVGLGLVVVMPIVVGTDNISQKAKDYVEGVKVGYGNN